MHTMKPIAIKDLSENFFEVIGKEWMLVTAGNKDHFNTMTASWGGMEQTSGLYLYPSGTLHV